MGKETPVLTRKFSGSFHGLLPDQSGIFFILVFDDKINNERGQFSLEWPCLVQPLHKYEYLICPLFTAKL